MPKDGVMPQGKAQEVKVIPLSSMEEARFGSDAVGKIAACPGGCGKSNVIVVNDNGPSGNRTFDCIEEHKDGQSPCGASGKPVTLFS